MTRLQEAIGLGLILWSYSRTGPICWSSPGGPELHTGLDDQPH